MDAFLALPREKTRRGAGKPMMENNVVQSHVAQSDARWRSARYFLHAAADEALETTEEHGAMDLDQRTRLRLASTWAIQSSREIVNTLFHDCGSMSVFEENPFERRLRDIDTVAQQGQGRILHYRRSVRSCLACRRRTSSRVGRMRRGVANNVSGRDRLSGVHPRAAARAAFPATRRNASVRDVPRVHPGNVG